MLDATLSVCSRFQSQFVHQARSVARAPGGEGSSSRSDANAINKYVERSSVAPECNRMPGSVERRPTGKATCHGDAMAPGSSSGLRGWPVVAYLRPVVVC